MPEPMTKFSTDIPVYYVTKKISPYLSTVSPNLISFASLLMMIPIINNLYYKGSAINLVIFVVFKQFLDCLDGSVAREHNKTSTSGLIVDNLCDTISSIIYALYGFYVIKKNKKVNYLQYLIICGVVYMIIKELSFLMKTIKCYHNDTKKTQQEKCGDYGKYNDIQKFIHDNSVLVQLAAILCFKISFTK